MSTVFRFCPYCGVPLVLRDVFGKERPVCSQCDYVQFLDPKVAVIGLITMAGRVLLIRRGVEPERGQWALPGGYMDAGEMPAEALRREIREEVGLDIEIGHQLGIYPMATSERVAGGIVIAYLAALEGEQVPALQRNDDVDEAGWFGPDEIPDEVAFASTRDLVRRWLHGDIDDR